MPRAVRRLCGTAFAAALCLSAHAAPTLLEHVQGYTLTAQPGVTPGDAATSQLMEMRLKPDTLIAPHSHDDDEIFYVAEGSLHWGDHALEAGGSIFTAADTIYSFRTGPQGARLLNFRARFRMRRYQPGRGLPSDQRQQTSRRVANL